MSLRVAAAVAVCSLVSLWSPRAEACGCFAPPDPSVPVVQAAERILFSVDNGVVTAHIQIQYAGDAREFGWLLPLPSVPTLSLGTDELFTQLVRTTQPRYVLTTRFNGACDGPRIGLSEGASFSAADGGASAGGGPLVLESSVGPYDYAVLKADSQTELLGWLRDNRYFVPSTSDAAISQYIRPGAYFLALKLRSGKSTGDLQPVVVKYPSDLPMIPIVLTSIGAVENMGILVWMLGNGRAIPRNYSHVVINDAKVDWLNGARNYNAVAIQAISETPAKHAFLTEYAGPSDLMRDVLAPRNRFGTREALAAQTTPGAFVAHLRAYGFDALPGASVAQGNPFGFGTALLPPVRNLVLAAIPYPPGLSGTVTEEQFLARLDFYLGEFRQQNPRLFEGYQLNFNPQALAGEIFATVVEPTREANAFFARYPTLTRLYTTLSPQDMTRDPVFSFNPALPEVSLTHTATLDIDCGVFGSSFTSPARLTTEQGFVIRYPSGRGGAPEPGWSATPAALRVETLGEEGPPQVTVDNTPTIQQVQGCGCTSGGASGLLLLSLLALVRRQRR